MADSAARATISCSAALSCGSPLTAISKMAQTVGVRDPTGDHVAERRLLRIGVDQRRVLADRIDRWDLIVTSLSAGSAFSTSIRRFIDSSAGRSMVKPAWIRIKRFRPGSLNRISFGGILQCRVPVTGHPHLDPRFELGRHGEVAGLVAEVLRPQRFAVVRNELLGRGRGRSGRGGWCQRRGDDARRCLLSVVHNPSP